MEAKTKTEEKQSDLVSILTIKMTQRLHQESHPNWYYDIPEMKTLILGSFPPIEKRWSYDFYYPNNSNPFWEALAGVIGAELKHYRCDQAVKERQGLMKR